MALLSVRLCIVLPLLLAIGLRRAVVAAAGSGASTLTAPSSAANLSLILIDPQDVTVPRGQPATLRCVATSPASAPVHQVTWYHGDAVVGNETRRFIRPDGTLYIAKVAGKKMPSLEGSYSCLVRNEHGALRSSPAKLRVANLSHDFNEQPSATVTWEDQPVLLPCRIQSVPQAHVTWERDGQPLPQSKRYVPQTSGDLLITMAQTKDSGTYVCIATNEILNKSRTSVGASLKVKPKDVEKSIKPELLPLHTSLNVTAQAGQNINLYCVATGHPVPRVRWTNGTDMVISNSSILVLEKVSAQDAGGYTCIADNSAGKASRAYSLDVQQTPYFNYTPNSKTFKLPGTVRLECQAFGLPQPEIVWYKDGQPLVLSDRLKKQQQKYPHGLVLSHTFTRDSGLYQCVAKNKVGQIWAAARLVANYSDKIPLPPVNVRCNPYDSQSICLQWDSPTHATNGTFSIHSFHAGPGPEFVTNKTHHLTERLRPNTNYTFYIRHYLKEASDESKNITCRTAEPGVRTLQFQPTSSSSLNVQWTQLSNDIPCGGAASYKIQWRKNGMASNNVMIVYTNSYVIEDLLPMQSYEVRVQKNGHHDEEYPWTEFTMPNGSNIANGDPAVVEASPTTSFSEDAYHFQGTPTSAHTIRLSWKDHRPTDSGYFMICYVEVKSGQTCEDGMYIESLNSSISVSNLKPYTVYEFRVRYHTPGGFYSAFSRSIECRTLEDVPSPVRDLMWKVINSSTVCLRWRVPETPNGHVQHYSVLYTSQPGLTLDQWSAVTVPANPKNPKPCWFGMEMVSVELSSLSKDEEYTLVVQAATKAGSGPPTLPQKFATSSRPFSRTTPTEAPEEDEKNQKLGILMGVLIALACVGLCLGCMALRWRCMKSRSRVRNRGHQHGSQATNGSQGAHQAASRARNSGSLCQQQTCPEAHEMQCLVSADAGATLTKHIPPVHPAHLDTKGGIAYPNGQINGLKPHMLGNGHIANGHVRITENPRYEACECNDSKLKTESDHLLKSRNHQCCDHPDSSLERSANSTQLTSLENSLANVSPAKLTPALGPNG